MENIAGSELQPQSPQGPMENVIKQSIQTETTPEPADLTRKERNRKFRQQIDLTKLYRRKLIRDWQVSVDYRRGKPFASQSDEDRISVPLDWSLTAEKQAALFSQVPQLRISHPPQTLSQEVSPWLHPFESRVNDILATAGIESVMDEVIPDCVNAAGFGAVLVAREALTEMVEVPAQDLSTFPPDLVQEILKNRTLPDGTPLEMTMVPRETDSRYTLTRISPADFLWPVGFQQSDFDKAPWIGRTGRLHWPVALQRFAKSETRPNGLVEADKTKVMGDDRSTLDRIDRLRVETDRGVANESEEHVSFDELFYPEHYYDSEVKTFSSIRHVVFLHGKEEPVIDEPWEGQRVDEQTNQLVGSMKNPLRVLTLNYITDDAIPPSDSAMMRPSVDEVNKARTQYNLQRQHSLPMRWVNTDRVDPTVLYTIMRGTWQGIIPIQGIGTNALGEVPRSGMSQDNYQIDKIAKSDALETFGFGPGMLTANVEMGTEGNPNKEAPVDARIARQRAKVGKFFVGIGEVLGGLVSIFEDPNSFGQGFSPMVSRTLAYSILADSSVLLDSNQRLRKLLQFINFTAKSGWVNIEPVIKEVATLSGLDPNVVVRAPEPDKPAAPNISLRLTGTEDLLNPLTLAFMINAGQAPNPEQVEQAKAMIAASVTPPNIPSGVAPPTGPDGQPLPQQQPPPPAVGEANPGWNTMPRVNAHPEAGGEGVQ
jgi:hypothetical protein